MENEYLCRRDAKLQALRSHLNGMVRYRLHCLPAASSCTFEQQLARFTLDTTAFTDNKGISLIVATMLAQVPATG